MFCRFSISSKYIYREILAIYKYRHKFLSHPLTQPYTHSSNIIHLTSPPPPRFFFPPIFIALLPFSILSRSFLFASLTLLFHKGPTSGSLHLALRRVKMADCNRGEDYFSSQSHEEASMGKKYGGLVPKKKPLISKDHERAFFDSADWALGKQGAGENKKSTAAVETLRPKLKRTPHQQLPPRRPACVSGKDTLEE